MSGLSCLSKDIATLDSFGGSSPMPELETFSPTDTLLYKWHFVIPGKGNKPVYCQRPYVQGIASDGSGSKVIYTQCDTMACPSCSRLWLLKKVFETCVHIEAYAASKNQRPSWGQGSVDYNQDFTLDKIRKIGRNINDKLKKQGVEAGIKIFHPYRIKTEIKDEIRIRRGKQSSSGFWNYLRNDDFLEELDLESFYDAVFLAPHYHFICFPGNSRYTGNKDLVLKKSSFKAEGRIIWTLESVQSVVRHVYYLLTHCGQLTRKNHHIKPISPFGEMWKQRPEMLVNPEKLQEIRNEVLAVINEGRDKPLVLDDDSIAYGIPEDDSDKNFIPMSEFRLYSLESHCNVDAFVSGLRHTAPIEHVRYIEYLIDVYNELCDSPDVPQKFKRLFVSGFAPDEMPDFVILLPGYGYAKNMFIQGLRRPPASFKLYGLEISGRGEPD